MGVIEVGGTCGTSIYIQRVGLTEVGGSGSTSIYAQRMDNPTSQSNSSIFLCTSILSGPWLV